MFSDRETVNSLNSFLTDGFSFVDREWKWPELLGITEREIDSVQLVRSKQKRCSEIEQVRKDVCRSLFFVPKKRRQELREQLLTIINTLLQNKEEEEEEKVEKRSYYQGYHDLCSVFLLVCGQRRATAIMDTLSRNQIKPFLTDSLENARHLLAQMMYLIEKSSKEVHTFLTKAFGEVEPFFALPWCLTWFSHNTNDLRLISRIFDVLLFDSEILVYLMASIVISCRKELLKVDCECGFVHLFLSKPLEELFLFCDIISKDEIDSTLETENSNTFVVYPSHVLPQLLEKSFSFILSQTIKLYTTYRSEISKLSKTRRRRITFTDLLPLFNALGASFLAIYLSNFG